MASRFAVGDRVDGLYDGNSDDAWYPGVVRAAHADDGTFDVLYDDGEEEHRVAAQFLRAHREGTLCVGTRVFGRYAGGDEWYPGRIQEVQEDGAFTIEYDDGEVEPGVALDLIRETLQTQAEQKEDGQATQPDQPDESGLGEADAEKEPEAAAPVEAPDEAVEREFAAAEPTPAEAKREAEDEDSPPIAQPPREPSPPPLQPATEPPTVEEARPRRRSRPQQAQQSAPGEDAVPSAAPVVDEYARLVATMERLESCVDDALAAKTLLSTLVKQMRSLPQATADLIHARGGESLLLALLRRHHTHAVIQCYGFVLLRRLCFLCGKSTHLFLRSGVVDLVAVAMRKFPEDAILQASACGALAVFTRVPAGLATLLELRVSHLVLATIIFHKAYSVHTRQVHYYACEVLLELCELGDRATVEALCGDGLSGPGLSDLSPLSLLLFLLRQALAVDDKKASCAAGRLLMCLASCHRHAAQIVLELNGLGELSTVMAKYPGEPGIQKYAASASQEIARCSMEPPASSPPRRRPQAKATSSSHGAKRRAHTQRSTVNGFPSPSHQQQLGGIAATSRDALSFSKYTSPIGQAPHLPPNIRPFAESKAPSPSAFVQRHHAASPLVILDGHGQAMASERKKFLKDERQSLLFETYGVDAKAALDQHHRTQGIKRRQLKTHLVSASAVSDGIQWASPVKAMVLHEPKPLSSRSEKASARPPTDDARRVRSSGEPDATEDEHSPATLRRRQQAKTSTRQEEKTPCATFRLKLDSAANGTATPVALSPKPAKADSSRGKTKAKPAKAASRSRGLGSTASTESLNSYAAQLFKEEMEAPEMAAARERLSFAEKLHKMIDKAKSSLAHGTATPRTPDKYHSPVKRTTKPPDAASAKKKHQHAPAPVASSRVAPASTKSSPAPVVLDAEPSAAAKKAAAKPTPAKKVVAPPPVVNRLAAPPKSVKPSASVAARPAPPANASVARPKPANPAPKPASTAKPTSAKPPAKSSKPAEATAATAAVAATAADAVALVVEDSSPDSSSVLPVEADSVAAEPSASHAVSTDADVATESACSEEPAPTQDEPAVDSPPSENILTTDAAEDIPAVAEAEQPLAEVEDPPLVDLPAEPETEAVVAAENSAEVAAETTTSADTDATVDEVLTAQEAAAVEDAVAVVTSAADDLYADEYNDFDELDNATHTLDDEAADAAGGVERDVSFEALMNLTAQVTEFTVASDPVVEAARTEETEVPQQQAEGTTTQGVVPSAESSSEIVIRSEETRETDELAHGEEEEPADILPVEGSEETPDVSDSAVEPPQGAGGDHDVSGENTNDDSNADEGAVSVAELDQINPDEATSRAEVVATSEPSASANEESSVQANDDSGLEASSKDLITRPVDEDRPESRQTELSYAGEDFDDSPDDLGDETTPEEPGPTADEPSSPEFSAAGVEQSEVARVDEPVDQNPDQDKRLHTADEAAGEAEPASSGSTDGPIHVEATDDSPETVVEPEDADETEQACEREMSTPAGEDIADHAMEAPAELTTDAVDPAEVPIAESADDNTLGEGQADMLDDCEEVPAASSHDEEAAPSNDDQAASVDPKSNELETAEVREDPAAFASTLEEPTDPSITTVEKAADNTPVAVGEQNNEERVVSPDGYGDADFDAEEAPIKTSAGDEETPTGTISGEESQVDQLRVSAQLDFSAPEAPQQIDQEPLEPVVSRETARSTSPESYGDDPQFEDALPQDEAAAEEAHEQDAPADDKSAEEPVVAVEDDFPVASSETEIGAAVPATNEEESNGSKAEPASSENMAAEPSLDLPEVGTPSEPVDVETPMSLVSEDLLASADEIAMSNQQTESEQLGDALHDSLSTPEAEIAVSEKQEVSASSEEVAPPAEEPRPSTADAYEETFDGDSQLDDSHQPADKVEEVAAPHELPPANDDASASQPTDDLQPISVTGLPERPTTADAYGDDAEFESDTARNTPLQPEEKPDELTHVDDATEPQPITTAQETEPAPSSQTEPLSRPTTADPYDNDAGFEGSTAREPTDESDVLKSMNTPAPQETMAPSAEPDMAARPTTADAYADDVEFEDGLSARKPTTPVPPAEVLVLDHQIADVSEEAAEPRTSVDQDEPNPLPVAGLENCEVDNRPTSPSDEYALDTESAVDDSAVDSHEAVENAGNAGAEAQGEELPSGDSDELNNIPEAPASDDPAIDISTQEASVSERNREDDRGRDESEQVADREISVSNDLHEGDDHQGIASPTDVETSDFVDEAAAGELESVEDAPPAVDESNEEVQDGPEQVVNTDDDSTRTITDNVEASSANPADSNKPNKEEPPEASELESDNAETAAGGPETEATEAPSGHAPSEAAEEAVDAVDAVEADRFEKPIETESKPAGEQTDAEYEEEDFGLDSGDAASGDAAAPSDPPQTESEPAQSTEACEAEEPALTIGDASVDQHGSDEDATRETSLPSGGEVTEDRRDEFVDTADAVDEPAKTPNGDPSETVEQVPEAEVSSRAEGPVQVVADATATEASVEDVATTEDAKMVQHAIATNDVEEVSNSAERSEELVDEHGTETEMPPAEDREVRSSETDAPASDPPRPEQGDLYEPALAVKDEVGEEPSHEELRPSAPPETEEVQADEGGGTPAEASAPDASEEPEASSEPLAAGDSVSVGLEEESSPTQSLDGEPETAIQPQADEAVAKEEKPAPHAESTAEIQVDEQESLQQEESRITDCDSAEPPAEVSSAVEPLASDLPLAQSETSSLVETTEENVSSSRSDEYAFDDETGPPVAASPAGDDEEALYKDEDNEFDDDAQAADAPPAPTPPEASPPSDDADYADFEADEPVAVAPEGQLPEAEPAASKPEADDDDQDAYNDFEDDEEPAKPKAEAGDAYEMEEAFEDDDKTPPRIPEPTVVAVATAPVGSAPLETPSTPTGEEGEYDEYDDFED